MARADNDKAAAIALHTYNTKLSESFYTPLQGVEVCIRNAVDTQMKIAYGERWFDPGVAPLQHPLTEMLERAKADIQKSGKPLEPGRVIAELNFGFWVSIMGPKYEDPLWRRVLRHAFPYRPKRHERKDVHNALNAIRRLRNRVMHHEPILHRNLESDHALILRIVSWHCQETSDWIKDNSRFTIVYDAECH